MNEDISLTKGDELLKKQFKYYKSNNPKPSLSDVITVDEDFSKDKVTSITLNPQDDPRTVLLGLNNLSEWKTYTFLKHPGLMFIKNPFTAVGQRFWIKQCLEAYPRKPNKMNLDIEIDLNDWWAECHNTDTCNKVLLKKLRWTTLGYHHDWDTKVYSEENKSPFPSELAELADVVACYLGYTSFSAQAAIVNYYHMDSTLSAHTDHSEVNLNAPLFSFSFGQSAIFLIGGQDKTVEPSALLLNSGDIVVMSKEARLCYHAVPKILPTCNLPWNNLSNIKIEEQICNTKYITNQKDIKSKMNRSLDNSNWSPFDSYVKTSRININVRQVLNNNKNSL